MSTREQFMTGGKWITNPKHLPIFLAENTYVLIKTANTSSQPATAGPFFDNMAFVGAQAAVTVADTYVTVADLTGAGFMFNCVSPCGDVAHTPTIKLTVDGVVHTFAPSANTVATSRLYLGPLTSGIDTAASGADMGPNGSTDYGFNVVSIGGIENVKYGVGIPVPTRILAAGWPCLRFETSLKVEMKCSDLSADAQKVKCAVTYRMDI